MIECYRSMPGGNSFVNWSNLKSKTESFLINYAKNNSKVNVIFKGKVGVHDRSELPKNLPSNCKFYNKGAGHDLLKDAKTIIGFNSSVVYEAIAAGRNVLVPNFNINYLKEKKELLILPSTNYLINNEIDLKHKLDHLTRNSQNNNKITKEEEETLFYYFGNKYGDSGARTKLFIENILFN